MLGITVSILASPDVLMLVVRGGATIASGVSASLVRWSMLRYSMVGHRHSEHCVCGRGGGGIPLT